MVVSGRPCRPALDDRSLLLRRVLSVFAICYSSARLLFQKTTGSWARTDDGGRGEGETPSRLELPYAARCGVLRVVGMCCMNNKRRGRM